MSGVYDFPGILTEARVREIVREELRPLREDLTEHSTKLRALVDALLDYLSASEERLRAGLQTTHDPQHPEQQDSIPDLRGGSVESEALHLLCQAGVLGNRDIAEVHDASPSLGLDPRSVGDGAAPGDELRAHTSGAAHPEGGGQ